MAMRKNSTHLAAKLGACVKLKRAERGMTQEAFAERCGFFRTYLSRIETGAANPSLNAIEVMALALETTPSQLLAWAEAY